ncbi:hypothetical protein LTR94_037275, partial [Friedmanniomyces endolithicus]
KAGDQAEPRLDARPHRAGNQCRGAVDRLAPAVGRLFVARTLHHPGEHHPAQFPRQGPGTARRRELFGLFQVDRTGLHRTL